MAKASLVVLISGSGSNLQAIIHAIEDGELEARICCVVSNNPDAYGLQRAREHGLEAESCNFAAALGRDRLQSGEQHGEAGEVGEAAQRVGHDQPAPRTELIRGDLRQIDVGQEFVENRLGAQQGAGDRC